MKKILVCQHVAHEPLGTLNPLLKAHGFRIRYANFGRYPDLKPDMEGYHGLIVLGGPMNVDEIDKHPHLACEVALIRQALDKNIPVLGICLGAQLLAKALGAVVSRNHKKEIGWYDVYFTEAGKQDPLFKHFRPAEKIFQWHGDFFELPRGAVHLARSDSCQQQAFRFGDRAYGFQFHLEVDEPMVERWLGISGNKEDVEALHGPDGHDKIVRETKENIARLQTIADYNFNAFIGLFGLPKKFHGLKSR